MVARSKTIPVIMSIPFFSFKWNLFRVHEAVKKFTNFCNDSPNAYCCFSGHSNLDDQQNIIILLHELFYKQNKWDRALF